MILVNSVAAAYWLPHAARAWIYRRCGVPVGRYTSIFPGQTLRPGRVSFGDRCFVNAGCVFDPGSAAVRVEDDVFLSTRVVLMATTHAIGPSRQRAGAVSSAPIVVGRGSWLGAAAIVLPGVTIAPGCVVGAGAVVTRSTEPDGLYIGAPARRVRTLPQ
jgi:maltose O-acetyltransferase